MPLISFCFFHQDCAEGFYRVNTTSHPFFGVCVACECYGHSSMCDPATGQCLDCQDNTGGEWPTLDMWNLVSVLVFLLLLMSVNAGAGCCWPSLGEFKHSLSVSDSVGVIVSGSVCANGNGCVCVNNGVGVNANISFSLSVSFSVSVSASAKISDQ